MSKYELNTEKNLRKVLQNTYKYMLNKHTVHISFY